MTHPVVMIVSRHSEPPLLPYALAFALCVLGFAWSVLELICLRRRDSARKHRERMDCKAGK